MEITKPFVIPKALIMQSYWSVKANKGNPGINQQILADFEKNWLGNLYKLWNRMSSGTYFPKPVRKGSIPKKQGGERVLGVLLAKSPTRLPMEVLNFEGMLFFFIGWI